MSERMTLTHDPIGARIEFRRLDEAQWQRTETLAEGVTAFRTSSGELAAVIIDVSLTDGGVTDDAASAIETLLGPQAVEAARSLHEGSIDVETSGGISARLVTTIELGRTPDGARNITLSSSGNTELIVSARLADTAGHWAVIVDVERSRPVAAGLFSDDEIAHARLRFGMDPEPGRYRVDITSSPLDFPSDAGGASDGTRSRRQRRRLWLAVLGAAVVVGGGALLAIWWPDRELPPSGPVTTIETTTTSQVDLAESGVFEAEGERIELTRISSGIVSGGDRMTLELRRTLVTRDTAWDPQVTTLDEAITSCERRLGVVNPIPADSSFPMTLVWHIDWFPEDDLNHSERTLVDVEELLSATALVGCGDSWADESAMELEATRELYFLPQRLQVVVPLSLGPGLHRLAVLRPTGEAWDEAQPVEILIVDNLDP